MADRIWNERGESILRKDDTFHHPESPEGEAVLRRIYGRNCENMKSNGSIYDKNGEFYIDLG